MSSLQSGNKNALNELLVPYFKFTGLKKKI